VTPESKRPSTLIAFGGNALNVPGKVMERQKEEFLVARQSMEAVAELIGAGFDRIVITHGNGPQVGQIALQQELTKHEFPRQITLDVCVADSQGRIGYILQNVFDNVCSGQGINKRAFSIITQVVVDPEDPAFRNPTKPIGVFYNAEEAERLAGERGWMLKEDAGRGFRRVVASPAPLEIVEQKIFHEILDLGFVAIGAGGGGIPVVRLASGELEGVEAVIDKDRTSALLAAEVGIDILVILTSVEFAFLNYNQPDQRPIQNATRRQMEEWLRAGHFHEGSMQPKIEAAVDFLKQGGKRAVIASLFDLLPAIEGKTGTQITP